MNAIDWGKLFTRADARSYATVILDGARDVMRKHGVTDVLSQHPDGIVGFVMFAVETARDELVTAWQDYPSRCDEVRRRMNMVRDEVLNLLTNVT